MPLDRDDHTQILNLLRAQVREALGPVDDRILSDFRWEDNPRANLLRYLSMLVEFVGLGAQTEAERVLRLLSEYIRTAEGVPVSEVRVLLTAAEQEQFGQEYLSLLGSPELEQLVAELRSLRSQILEEGGGAHEPEAR